MNSKLLQEFNSLLHEGISEQDLADVLQSRIMFRYPDLLDKYGFDALENAVNDVASFHAGAEELGTSDISIMLKQIIKRLDSANLAEMDKSAPQPGRDGRVSHSTYGSRDKKDSDYFTGKESPVKAITAKQAEKDALDILKKQGVAEDKSTKKISFKLTKGKNKFSTTMMLDGVEAGVYQYDANSGRSIAEVFPEFKGQGYGKILVLNAIYTAAKLGMDFIEDESRTAEYDNVLDSLSDNGLAVNDDGYWYVTGEGEHFLKQRLKQDVAEGSDKLQGTPVVSLSDFDSKDTKKDRYGRTIPTKLKKDDPRVKFYKEPEKKDVAEGKHKNASSIFEGIQQVDEINWKKAAATGAMALGALGAMGNAHAIDLSKFNTDYLQQVASGAPGRFWFSAEEAKAELARRGASSDETPTQEPQLVQQLPGKKLSREYLEKAADPNRVGRYFISVEKAQELLDKMGN